MLGHLLHGDLPTAHGMAFLAVAAELAFVNVRMAISAVSAHIRKNQLDVALAARHGLMSPPERIGGFIMVEVRLAPDRAPACRSMAAFARNPQGSVRIARSSSL